MTRLCALKCLIAAVACSTLIACSANASKPEIEKEVLLRSKTSWDGTPYVTYPEGQPELTIIKLKIPPNTVLPWHTHPMPNAAYVVSGELTVETKESGKKMHLKAGQTLPEMVNIVHRGNTGDSPVELIVFYAGSEGIPLSE